MRVLVRTAGKSGWMAAAESTNGNHRPPGEIDRIERPLSVMERKAFFERLQASANLQKIHPFKVRSLSNSVAVFPVVFLVFFSPSF